MDDYDVNNIIKRNKLINLISVHLNFLLSLQKIYINLNNKIFIDLYMKCYFKLFLLTL
jgi:hypothetical protein